MHQIQTDAGPHTVCGFLTTSPNVIVEPIHPKAHARNPDDRRRVGRLDARSLGRSKSAATTVTGRRLERYRQGRPRQHEALTGKHTRIQRYKSRGKE